MMIGRSVNSVSEPVPNSVPGTYKPKARDELAAADVKLAGPAAAFRNDCPA
jgi:hypothetical protein